MYSPIYLNYLNPSRLELQKRMPWFCIHEPESADNVSSATEKSAAPN